MLRLLKRFRDARDGLAAIEFALILPVLSVLILGVIELSSALECRQRVTAVAAQSADLVAQYTQITTSQMNDVVSAMNQILYPFPTTSSKIVLSSITSDGNGGGKVAWSKGSSGAALRSVNSTVTLPGGLMTAYSCSGGVCTGCANGACSLIMAEVTYNYSSYSNTLKFVTGPITMTESFYAKPRRSATIGFGP
jgi:Flp pilus assembly protein TadG